MDERKQYKGRLQIAIKAAPNCNFEIASLRLIC